MRYGAAALRVHEQCALFESAAALYSNLLTIFNIFHLVRTRVLKANESLTLFGAAGRFLGRQRADNAVGGAANDGRERREGEALKKKITLVVD